MVKANELRIGNWASVQGAILENDKVTEQSLPVIIKAVAEEGYLTSFNGQLREMLIDTINPIPLTEEWLIRFGFKKVLHHIKGTELNDEYELGFVRISHYLGTIHFKGCTPLKYVHQLQNLYHALTDEELIVK